MPKQGSAANRLQLLDRDEREHTDSAFLLISLDIMATVITQTIEATKYTERFYRPELDVLRFIAFGMVFFLHANYYRWWSAWGNFGVAVFFLLSAFLLTELLLREKSATGKVHVGSFYIRRILRIWPLYFAALTIGFLLLTPMRSHHPFSSVDVASYFLFIGNWRAATHGFLPLGMTVLWSIAVEEQFYLVWPWIVRGLDRKGILRLSILMWMVSQASVVTLCLWHISFFPGIWCNSFADLQFFALGSGLSVILAGRIPAHSVQSRSALFAGGAALFLPAGVLIWIPHFTNLPYVLPGVLLSDVASVALFLSLFGIRVPSRAAPAVYLGKISYGLYITHLWLWVLVGMALGIKPLSPKSGGPLQYLITIPILFSMATLSYNYFEKPFLKLKSRFEFVKSRAA